MVRVLLVSKALIAGAYQRKAALLARMGVDLTVVVPPYWKDDAGRKAPLEQASLDEARLGGGAPAGAGGAGGAGGYRLVVEPMALNGHFHTHFYPRLAARVREVRPQILHMDEEPYNLATAQAFWIARRAGRGPSSSPGRTSCGAIPRRSGGWSATATASPRGRSRGTGRRWRCCAGRATRARRGWCRTPRWGSTRGSSTAVLRRATPRRREGRPFTVGFVGRLRPQKGAHLLVQAVGALGGDTRLELLGWGPEEGRLRALAEEVGLGHRFAIHQALPSERVPEFLSRLDALVLPSLTFPNWKEQFGRALTEAMACEVPVVGSDRGRSPASSGTPDWSSRRGTWRR